MSADLPFVAEYAKSSRASCKMCKSPIQKENLRIGIMVQSAHFDGKVPLWHHFHCFFNKKSIKTIADIANFDNIRWEDQKKIKDKIGESKSNGPASVDTNSECSDFSIEYAKSSRSKCRVCGETIMKGVIRISKLDTESVDAKRFGPIPGWRHMECFVKVKHELEFNASADKLPGYQTLSEEDKAIINEQLGQPGIKRKVEKEENKSVSKKVKVDKESKEDKALEKQSKMLFDMRDKLQANLSKKDMVNLLQHNEQYICVGESRLLDHLSDCLVFGALKQCPECKNGRPRYKIDGYHCAGNISEWTKCQYFTRNPEREPFIVPEEFKEEYDFLQDYKYEKRERLFPSTSEVPSALAGSSKKGLPLEGYKIAVFGRFKIPKEVVVKKIGELGGSLHSKIDNTTKCCISTEAEVTKDGPKVQKARELNIHIVSPNMLEDVKNGKSVGQAVKDNLLSSWGDDPSLKFGVKAGNTVKEEEVSIFQKSVPQKLKVTVKGGAAVEPDSGMEDKCCVYQKKGDIYNAVLGCVDVARGTNTYYKLQILQHNKKSKYWLFRAWGRVGTTIGGNKLEKMSNVELAVKSFEDLYLEKTGNEWKDRKNFVKQPHLMYPLDIDYGQECEIKELKPGANSKLSKPVQELICLIFDIEAMKKAMLEFEIDLKKMPLGKLSKKQIEMAYSVLTQVLDILNTENNQTKILDASNRFYTLIPHDFGLKQPPLLDNEELIKSKLEMLDSLLDMEIAYNLLKDGHDDAKDPVDEHYEKLKADIEVLDKENNEFKTIETYLKNTHAETHKQYSLEIDEVFKVNRHGESKKYKKFKELHNKKLLWHGSRLTNYVGILSQGLRIAPPEAPVTGYMFGKGVYFADMVSKSANYCFSNKRNPTGLLLLCEVALGDMYERADAEFITKLPKNKHSTKGLGQTIPDPKETGFLEDVEVPYGKPVKSDVKESVLLYNEYVVYDANQINIKYLLKVNFKWKR